MFSVLAPEDIDRLNDQRTVALEAARAATGVALQQSPLSLRTLQEIVDAGCFAPHQTYELQCLGVAFGDPLAADGRFHWVIITDEYGRDPTLRWKNTSLNLNALTMISKRIEAGNDLDLAGLWDWAFARGAEADQREGN